MMRLISRARRRRPGLRQLRARVAVLERALAGGAAARPPLWDVTNILQGVRDAVVVAGPDLRIQLWNPAAEDLFGWPAEVVLGRRTTEFLPVRYPDGSSRERVLRALETEGHWRGEALITRRDGVERAVEAATQLLYDPGGAPVGSVVVTRDITARKEAEAEREQLLAREREARAALEQSLAAQTRIADALRRSEARLAALAEASRCFAAAAADLDSLSRTITGYLALAIGDLCSLRLLSPDKAELVVAHTAHPSREAQALAAAIDPIRQRADEGHTRQVLAEGQPLYIAQVQPEALRALAPPQFHPYLDRIGVSSLLIVPLRARGQVLGTLTLCRDRGGAPYTPDDLAMLADVADRAALALAHALARAAEQAADRARADALGLLDALFATAPIGLAFLDTGLRYRRVNRVLAELNGLPVEAHLGRTPAEILPSLAPAIMPCFRQVLASGEALHDIEIQGTTPADPDQLRDWLVSYYPVPGADGASAGVGVVMVETTERKRAAEALLASEERFRTIIENSQDATLLTDAESRVHYCSAAITRILGYAPAELLGRRFSELIEPSDRQAGTPELAERLAQPGTLGELVVRVRHRDGGWRWLQVRRHNQLANPAIGYVVSSLHDISEQRQAEEALGRYVERVQALHAIDRAIIQAESPAAIAEAALRQLRAAVPLECASVLLYDRAAQLGTVLAVSVDRPTELRPGAQFVWGPDEPGGGWADAQAEIVDDLRASPGLAQGEPCSPGDGWRALLRAPLRARDQLIGTLNLWSSTPGAFREAQRAVVQEVADQLAVAIQHARLFEEVSHAHDHLRALSRRLVDSQEQERRHIARELHDEIGQMLTGLKIGMELAAQQAPGQVAQALEPLRADIGALMERVRALSLNLRPMMLDDLGLLPALQWHVSRYTAQTQIAVALRHNGLERRFPPEVETAAYRVVQEALTNVARHARVRQASVHLLADESRLMLRIDDEGAGFAVEDVLAAQATGGLSGMLERVRLLGGEMTIEAGPGEGTHVIAELPLTDNAQGAGRESP